MIKFIITLANAMLITWTIYLSLEHNRTTYRELEMHRTYTYLVALASMFYIIYS